jgi:hypothetical protein
MQCLLDDMRWRRRRKRSDFAIMFADDLPVDGPMSASAVKHQDFPLINTTTRMSHGLAQLVEDKSVSSGSIQAVEPGSHCCAITASESQNAVDLTSYQWPVVDLKESGPPLAFSQCHRIVDDEVHNSTHSQVPQHLQSRLRNIRLAADKKARNLRSLSIGAWTTMELTIFWRTLRSKQLIRSEGCLSFRYNTSV